MKVRIKVLAGVALLALLGAGAIAWFQRSQHPVGAADAPAVSSTPTPTPRSTPIASASAVESPPSEPAVRHPIETLPVPPASQPFDATAALTELLGRKTTLSMFQLDDFSHRLVATVDGLGRTRASSRLWPVHPVGSPLLVENAGDAQAISADNGLRYTPFVLLFETIDMRRAVEIYKAMYPSMQQAYEDLGYPKRYFNDRLVDVIDLLLATPSMDQPLRVHLPPIEGSIAIARPWVLYEFDDPSLESRPAGQKILLRMGPVNERRVKARLVEMRQLVASDALGH